MDIWQQCVWDPYKHLRNQVLETRGQRERNPVLGRSYATPNDFLKLAFRKILPDGVVQSEAPDHRFRQIVPLRRFYVMVPRRLSGEIFFLLVWRSFSLFFIRLDGANMLAILDIPSFLRVALVPGGLWGSNSPFP